jgi:hypothetical protein
MYKYLFISIIVYIVPVTLPEQVTKKRKKYE